MAQYHQILANYADSLPNKQSIYTLTTEDSVGITASCLIEARNHAEAVLIIAKTLDSAPCDIIGYEIEKFFNEGGTIEEYVTQWFDEDHTPSLKEGVHVPILQREV